MKPFSGNEIFISGRKKHWELQLISSQEFPESCWNCLEKDMMANKLERESTSVKAHTYWKILVKRIFLFWPEKHEK